MSEVKNIPRLRFPDFEETWNSCKVEDLFEFKNGLNKEKEFFGRGIPIINFVDVYKNPHLTSKKLSGLVDLSESEISRFCVSKGDLFFTRTSETIHDIGMSSSLIEDIPNCVFSGFTLRARPKENVFDSKFTGYLFRTEKIRKEITTKSSMTTRALTSGSLLKKVVFNYPNSKEEQQKIADFLTAVDKRIELLEKKKTLLETYKKGVMKKIFNQEIRFKDNNGKDFPDWEEKRLGKVCNIQKGKQLNKSELIENGQYPAINGGIEPSGYTDEWNTVANTITISEGGNSCGYVNYIKTNFWCGGHCYSLLDIQNYLLMDYLYEYLKFKEQSIMNLRVGSGLPNIQKRDIHGFQILIPSLGEQKILSKFLSTIGNQIELLESQINKSKDWKKGLLQKMFV